ncbi:MAG: ferrochelatase [Bdellovibrionales bacterium]|nr:ferrochelatase [Bdellovibrionales bacterium]
MKTAILITNLGTPKSTSLNDIKTYLSEFLMDPDVIPLPTPLRWLLVKGLIVPTRSPKSQHAYQSIWTDRGSPLLYHSIDLQNKLQDLIGSSAKVFLGMRYSTPSLSSQLEQIRKENFDQILLIPLYPQYSDATTGTTLKAVSEWVSKNNFKTPIRALSHFYWDANLIDNYVENGKALQENFQADHTLISFHGLPQKMLREGLGKGHCYQSNNCCIEISEKNIYCYRSQAIKTAKHIAEKMQLQDSDYTICFQSRLGRAEWIQPYTQDTIIQLAKAGKKRLLVFSPSFVADCLETLEEIEIGLKQVFIEHGGEELKLVPSLNSSNTWVHTLSKLIDSDHFEDLEVLTKKLHLN